MYLLCCCSLYSCMWTVCGANSALIYPPCVALSPRPAPSQGWWWERRLTSESADPPPSAWSRTVRSVGSRGRSWYAASLRPSEPPPASAAAAPPASETCSTEEELCFVLFYLSRTKVKSAFWEISVRDSYCLKKKNILNIVYIFMLPKRVYTTLLLTHCTYIHSHLRRSMFLCILWIGMKIK